MENLGYVYRGGPKNCDELHLRRATEDDLAVAESTGSVQLSDARVVDGKTVYRFTDEKINGLRILDYIGD